MRKMKVVLLLCVAVLLCVSLTEAAKSRSACSVGACVVPAPMPIVKPAPAPAPEVAPVPPVVTDGVVVESQVSAEVRRSIVKVASAPVRAVAALAGAVRNREHKPVVKAVKAVGKLTAKAVGRERRAERR
jgi:hypothetical protein